MTELNDQELNIRLAEAMNNEGIGRMYSDSGESYYKDPSIVLECLTWLLDNGYIKLWDPPNLEYVHFNKTKRGSEAFRDISIFSRDKPRCIALAYLEAKKDE